MTEGSSFARRVSCACGWALCVSAFLAVIAVIAMLGALVFG